MSYFRIFVAVLLCASAACSPHGAKAPAKPIAGSLNVLVRPPDRTIEPIAITESGALPVQSGGAMTIDVDLNEPAFIYLIWVNADGEVLPLYPWNNETLEVKDISQPPPVRRATKRIFSPLLGRSWTFGNTTGPETVILLARRTALPENIQLAGLLASPPAPEFEHPTDVISVRMRWQDNGKGPSKATEMAPGGRPLATFLEPLTKHFDLIEAVAFVHEDKKPD